MFYVFTMPACNSILKSMLIVPISFHSIKTYHCLSALCSPLRFLCCISHPLTLNHLFSFQFCPWNEGHWHSQYKPFHILIPFLMRKPLILFQFWWGNQNLIRSSSCKIPANIGSLGNGDLFLPFSEWKGQDSVPDTFQIWQGNANFIPNSMRKSALSSQVLPHRPLRAPFCSFLVPILAWKSSGFALAMK